MCCGKGEGTAQMFQQRRCIVRIIVEGAQFIQNRIVACFSEIGTGTGNQPQRIIVEAGADIRIAFLGQRLILVVGTALPFLVRG